MAYASLREFIERLEAKGRLVRVKAQVSPQLEITEIHTRLLAEGGPAVLFENVEGSTMPVLTNLFGTLERVAWGMNREPAELREIGEMLAFFRQPEPPGGWREAVELVPHLRAALARLETGGYGQCVECGEAIPAARLCALPEATTCVACQERHELTAAALPVETRHQRMDRGVAALLAEELAATTEQSAHAEDAPQEDTRGSPAARRQLRAKPLGADTPGRLAIRARQRPAGGSVPGTVTSGSERRRSRTSSPEVSRRGSKTNRQRIDGVNGTGRGCGL